MSIFSRLNLDDAPEGPRVPDGDYVVETIQIEVREYRVRDPEHLGSIGNKIFFVYEILHGSYAGILVYSKGHWANPWDSPMRQAYLKRWLRNHGIAEKTRLNDLQEPDLEGLQVSVRVRDGLAVSVRPLDGSLIN